MINKIVIELVIEKPTAMQLSYMQAILDNTREMREAGIDSEWNDITESGLDALVFGSDKIRMIETRQEQPTPTKRGETAALLFHLRNG